MKVTVTQVGSYLLKLGHEAWGWRFDVRLGEDGGGRVQDEGDALPRVSEFPEMAGGATTGAECN